jgi:hypothetical protein
MVAAVDLDQLAQTRAPGAWLVDLRRALFAWHPQAQSVSKRFFEELKYLIR